MNEMRIEVSIPFYAIFLPSPTARRLISPLNRQLIPNFCPFHQVLVLPRLRVHLYG